MNLMATEGAVELVLTDSERGSDHNENKSSCFISTNAETVQFSFINVCY